VKRGRVSLLIEKRVRGALAPDCGDFAVTGIDERVVGKLKNFVEERLHDLFKRTAPQIGAANAACEECVAGIELWLSKDNLPGCFREEKANAAGSVTGSVQDLGVVAAPLEGVAVFQKLIDSGEFGRLHAEKSGLDLHGVIQGEIIVVHHDRRAGVLMEPGNAADMIDVGVSTDDRLDRELVAAQKAEDAFDFVARINDDSFPCFGIADDGAVALEHANWDFDVDHLRIGGIGCVRLVGHRKKYNIGGRCQDFTATEARDCQMPALAAVRGPGLLD
jgi:hypothetical protein